MEDAAADQDGDDIDGDKEDAIAVGENNVDDGGDGGCYEDYSNADDDDDEEEEEVKG